MKKVTKITNIHLKETNSKLRVISCIEIYDDVVKMNVYRITMDDNCIYEGTDKDLANNTYVEILKKAKENDCKYRIVKIV